MNLVKRWRQYMGPQDERIAAVENRALKASFGILLVGSILCLYYGIMLNQVADTTEHPLLTPLGESVVPLFAPLAVVVLVAGVVQLGILNHNGVTDSRRRYAQVDSVPWDYVVIISVLSGAAIGVVTCLMRIVAEIQIVGIGNVAWAGDLAMGVVFFGIGFAVALAAYAAYFQSAITRRHQLERELED